MLLILVASFVSYKERFRKTNSFILSRCFFYIFTFTVLLIDQFSYLLFAYTHNQSIINWISWILYHRIFCFQTKKTVLIYVSVCFVACLIKFLLIITHEYIIAFEFFTCWRKWLRCWSLILLFPIQTSVNAEYQKVYFIFNCDKLPQAQKLFFHII
jgi:hypothetical protein